MYMSMNEFDYTQIGVHFLYRLSFYVSQKAFTFTLITSQLPFEDIGLSNFPRYCSISSHHWAPSFLPPSLQKQLFFHLASYVLFVSYFPNALPISQSKIVTLPCQRDISTSKAKLTRSSFLHRFEF